MTMWNNLLQAVEAQNCLTINNTVLTGLNSENITPDKGMRVLQQYFYLVANIVQFLITAMVRIPNQAVKEELRRNIEEELGSRNNGVPHQQLLEKLLRQELGIEAREFYSEATAKFISELWAGFHTAEPYHVAGMIYALEATAKAELIMVAHLINLATERQVIEIAKLTDDSVASDSTLEGFIALHTKDFEVGHESGLRRALEEFIGDNNNQFREGVAEVLIAMQLWWNRLAKESV